MFETRQPDITIRKASGETAAYDRSKLIQSLERSGAGEAAIFNVVREVEGDIESGMSTRKIYRKAFQLLRSHSQQAATQYKLKEAVMALGPSGYPFEQFIAALFERQGFETRVGTTLQGKCVKHEIDVIARKNETVRLTECKFKNMAGSKSDVKVALYFQSRFLDVAEAMQTGTDYSGLHMEGWLVTNGKFSEDAMQYGTCAGLHLLGWDYPQKSGLIDQIRNTALVPVTVLHALSGSDKSRIMDAGVVVCRELRANPGLMDQVGIDKKRQQKARAELDAMVY